MDLTFCSVLLCLSDALSFPSVPEPDWECVGRAHTRGLLDEERQGARFRRALQTQVRARQVRQHHNRGGHHGRLWQIRSGGQEQVWQGGRRVHRERVQPRGRGEQGGQEVKERRSVKKMSPKHFLLQSSSSINAPLSCFLLCVSCPNAFI